MGKISIEDYLEEDKEFNFKQTKHKKRKLNLSDERFDYTTY